MPTIQTEPTLYLRLEGTGVTWPACLATLGRCCLRPLPCPLRGTRHETRFFYLKKKFNALKNTVFGAVFPLDLRWQPCTLFLVPPRTHQNRSYVGSQFLCGSHEGHSGETVEWLGNRTIDIMSAGQPDIILFMAGTNDFFWYGTPSRAFKS